MRRGGLGGRGGGPSVRGFTLLEVVIALLVLELAVLGAVGILVVASATLSRAERLERAAGLVEGVLDSLAATPAVGSGSRTEAGATVTWTVASDAHVRIVASGPRGDTLLEVQSVLPPEPVAP